MLVSRAIIIIGGEVRGGGRVVRKGGGRIKGEGDYRRVADTIELILWGGVEGGGGKVKGNKVEGRVGVRCRLKIDR